MRSEKKTRPGRVRVEKNCYRVEARDKRRTETQTMIFLLEKFNSSSSSFHLFQLNTLFHSVVSILFTASLSTFLLARLGLLCVRSGVGLRDSSSRNRVK